MCDRWRSVYEHDAEGNCIRGDLDELKEHMRTGRTVQVGIRQLFGLAEDNDSGPEHVSYVASMQPIIKDGHGRSNCDLVVFGAPKWPFTWKDGVHLAVMRPETSGNILCFIGEPGKLPFEKTERRRAMVWMVAQCV